MSFEGGHKGEVTYGTVLRGDMPQSPTMQVRMQREGSSFGAGNLGDTVPCRVALPHSHVQTQVSCHPPQPFLIGFPRALM